MATQKVDMNNFQDDVLGSDVPVVVDFWAEWCGPCKAIGPSLEEISDEMAGKVKIAKVNIDENPDIAAQYGVRSPHIVEAIAAMESHIGDPLNLSQLALIADVSTRHLNRLFVDGFGQSVMEHYRDMRLETAQRLVRSTAMKFDEIASATGFAHAGHFSNAYQAKYGRRPKADRMAPADDAIYHMS